MSRSWTFGQKLGAGFMVMVALTITIGAIAVYSLRMVVSSKDRVIGVNAQDLVDTEALRAASLAKSAGARGFLLTREERFIEQLLAARSEWAAALARLKSDADDEGRRMLEQIDDAEREHHGAIDAAIALRRGDAPVDVVARNFEEQVAPKRATLTKHLEAFVVRERQLLDAARRSSTDTATSATNLVIGFVLAGILFAAIVALTLTRALTRQIGTAVTHVQSSSAELQAAANQQAMGSKEQSTAMNEITTTIRELLATSRQIAESAQRVAKIAGETVGAARGGESIVGRANESITGIRRQVDLVVGHMLDLGKKSQQIGSVLEIVSELAEQTNILAINATIEAAGAGDAGKRFAVVADEIRKLADRVAGSTKEIRGLIEDVRSAVNTTVMATEGGSKAVDTGSRQFGDVASSFKQIAELVSTTTEAAREIELSTKQQTTAVEQVNIAISNVAQATKETEASSGQTLQTASQLTTLSRDLVRLIQPQAAA